MPFDSDIFISKISKRRALWDNKTREYSNRDIKLKMWIEVATIVINGWDSLPNEEKNKEVKELQKRCKSLRDAFTRELRAQKMPSGSGQQRRKKYFYFDQMLFLVGTVSDGESTTSLQEEPSTASPTSPTSPSLLDEDLDMSTATSTPTNLKRKDPFPPNVNKRRQQSPFEMGVLEHLKKSRVVNEEEEADRNFLLSFLPTFTKLSQSKKLWARVCITQIMQQAAEPVYPSSYPTSISHSGDLQHVPYIPNTYQQPPPQWYPWQPSQPNNATSPANDNLQLSSQSSSSSAVQSPTCISDLSNIDVFSVMDSDLTQLV